MRSQFIHMWQQKATPEGLTEEVRDVGWPESQHHLPQRWQKWGLRLSAIILSMCLPMTAGRKRVEGRTWANLRYLLPQWWNSLCFQWQILFPSSAQWCSFLCMEALSSPSPEIYYFTNPNMSEIVLHLHFKPDKIIFRVTFFPWRQLQIEYFLPCYLSLPLFPGQLHFETANHFVLRERPQSPAAIFSSRVRRRRSLHFPPRS